MQKFLDLNGTFHPLSERRVTYIEQDKNSISSYTSYVTKYVGANKSVEK